MIKTFGSIILFIECGMFLIFAFNPQKHLPEFWLVGCAIFVLFVFVISAPIGLIIVCEKINKCDFELW